MKSAKEIEQMSDDDLRAYYDQRCAAWEADKTAGNYVSYWRTVELAEMAEEIDKRGIITER